jgi:hypothetical protein
MQPVDEYALMEWLKGEALNAHNAPELPTCNKCHLKTLCDKYSDYECIAPIYELAINKVITHIENGRKNQRPHVKERI